MSANDKIAGTSPTARFTGGLPALDTSAFKMPDPALVGRSMADIAERSQRLVGEWLTRQPMEDHAADPLNIGRAFMEMTTRLMANPARLMQAQLGFWQDYVTLWQNTTRRIMGMATEPVIDPAANDRRFRAFDSRTGKELWTAKLDYSAHAIPITYLGKDGKQYVAIVAAGFSALDDPGPPGADALVVFALN